MRAPGHTRGEEEPVGLPGAVRLQKQLMVRWRERDLPGAIRAGIAAFAASYATGEPREGAAAFLEKRAPRFGEPR